MPFAFTRPRSSRPFWRCSGIALSSCFTAAWARSFSAWASVLRAWDWLSDAWAFFAFVSASAIAFDAAATSRIAEAVSLSFEMCWLLRLFIARVSLMKRLYALTALSTPAARSALPAPSAAFWTAPSASATDLSAWAVSFMFLTLELSSCKESSTDPPLPDGAFNEATAVWSEPIWRSRAPML